MERIAECWPGGCFINLSRAFQYNLTNIYNARNNIYAENIKLKLWMCAQSMALGTRTKFQPENSHKKYDFGNIQMSREANLKDMVRVKEPHGVSRPGVNTELFMSQCLLSVTQIITARKDCITHTITFYFLVCISVLRVVRQKHAYWYQLNLLPEKLCTLLFKSNGIFFCGDKIWCLFLRYRL